jgi:hypothetical protein
VLTEDSWLYSRPLPGGGFVAIEATEPGPDGVSVYAQLLVERRADPARRVGHSPPVVAEALAVDAQHALDALYGIAANNVEIARALMRWQGLRG